jgi:outer membrane protein OmpA-like peptidoglycan-associated protein
MTSLAIIFILLLTAYLTPSHETEPAPSEAVKQNVKAVLQERLQGFGLPIETDVKDPLAIRVVVPEDLLNFEFGKSVLSPTANQFLTNAMPLYAEVLCGPLREKIDSVVIEGHTDDFGSDTLNLKLSQERSFSVMVKALDVIAIFQPKAYQCFEEMTSASGRGKQDLIYETGHVLNREKSRRVVFKIRLRSVEQLQRLAAAEQS